MYRIDFAYVLTTGELFSWLRASSQTPCRSSSRRVTVELDPHLSAAGNHGGRCRRGNVSCRAAGERRPGEQARRESGRTRSGFSRRPKKGPGRIRGRETAGEIYAAFLVPLLFFVGAVLTGGFFSALAFSFAANSCLTLRAMVSVSTL